jgi:hypothetical protein
VEGTKSFKPKTGTWPGNGKIRAAFQNRMPGSREEGKERKQEGAEIRI